MRSKRFTALVAGALASGVLSGMETYSALAQGMGGMPGYPAGPSSNAFPVSPTNRDGMPVSTSTPRGVYAGAPVGATGPGGSPASPFGMPPGAQGSAMTGPGGAPASPYSIPPGVAPGDPAADAVRTSYASPSATPPGAYSPYASDPRTANPRTMPLPGASPGTMPVAANGGAPPASPVKPYLASVPSPADAPKPKGIRKFFSYLWHGGSEPGDENKHAPYDMSTGRTDLMNARPWMKSNTSK